MVKVTGGHACKGCRWKISSIVVWVNRRASQQLNEPKSLGMLRYLDVERLESSRLGCKNDVARIYKSALDALIGWRSVHPASAP